MDVRQSRLIAISRVLLSYTTPILMLIVSIVLVRKTNENIILKEYEFKGSVYITEINATATLYKHRKSHYEVLNIKSDQKENYFAVAFKYPGFNPAKSVNLLFNIPRFGSINYTGDDFFDNFRNYSLISNISNEIYRESFQFHFSTLYKSEFEKTLPIFLQSIFYPEFNYDSFLKSIRYVKKNETADKISYEIHGEAYDLAKNFLHDRELMTKAAIINEIYNITDTVYGLYGNPLILAKTNFDQIINEYRSIANPSNALFYHFGDFDEYTLLQNLSQHLNYTYTKNQIRLDSNFSNIMSLQSKTISLPNITISQFTKRITSTWLIADVSNISDLIDVDVLSHLLTTGANSILHEELIESSNFGLTLCDSQFNYKTGIPHFTICVDGVPHEDSLIPHITRIFKSIIAKGFNATLLQTVIEKYEIMKKETSQSLGRNFFKNMIFPWLYGYNPLQYASFNWEIDRIKKLLAVQPKYFELVLRRRLLENQKRLDLEFIKDDNFEAKFIQNEAKIAEELASHQENFLNHSSNNSYNFINVSFEEINESIYSTKFYTINDVVYSFDVRTNDIVYIRIINSIDIDNELIEDFPIFMDVFGKSGFDEMNQEEFNKKVNQDVGGISIKYNIQSTDDGEEEDKTQLQIIIEGKTLSRNVNKLLEYLTSIISRPKLYESKKLMTILETRLFELKRDYLENTAKYANYFSSAGLTRAAALREMLFGVTYIKKLSTYLNDDKREDIKSLLDKLYTKVFINGFFKSSLHCNWDVRHKIEKRLEALMEKFNSHQPNQKGIDVLRLFQSSMSQTTKYILKNANSLSSLTFSYKIPRKKAAALSVMARIIANYDAEGLQNYKIDTDVVDDNLEIIHFSFWDIQNATAAYNDITGYFMQLSNDIFNEVNMKKCIYNIIRDLNNIQPPGSKNLDLFIKGMSLEKKSKIIHEYYNLNLADIYEAVKYFSIQSGSVCITSNAPELKDEFMIVDVIDIIN